MRHITRWFLLLMALTLAGAAAAEESAELTEGWVTCGDRQVRFLYPAACEAEDEGDIGFLVYLNEMEWLSLTIPKNGRSGVEQLRDNMGEGGEIHALTEEVHLFAERNVYQPSPDPALRRLDIVSIGLNLPDGTGMVISAFAQPGHDEIYGLLLTVLSSITDAEAVEQWLTDAWLPADAL